MTKKNDIRYKEMDKAIKGNANLKRELGSAKNVDDEELFELLADEYNVDITNYLKADQDYRTFYKENKEFIDDGRKIANSYMSKQGNNKTKNQSKKTIKTGAKVAAALLVGGAAYLYNTQRK